MTVHPTIAIRRNTHCRQAMRASRNADGSRIDLPARHQCRAAGTADRHSLGRTVSGPVARTRHCGTCGHTQSRKNGFAQVSTVIDVEAILRACCPTRSPRDTRTERASDVSRCFVLKGHSACGPGRPNAPVGELSPGLPYALFNWQTLSPRLPGDRRHCVQHPSWLTNKIVHLTHKTGCRCRFRSEAARITVPVQLLENCVVPCFG